MKKVLLIFVAIMAIILSSCSNDLTNVTTPVTNNQEVTSNAELESLAKLQNNITILNDSIHQKHIETRGILSFFKWLKCIVVSDVTGALWGLKAKNLKLAVGGAVLCSAGTAVGEALGLVDSRALRGKNIYMNDNLDNLVFQRPNKELSFQDSIGYFHNKLLLSSFETPNLSLDELPATTVKEFNNSISSVKLTDADTTKIFNEFYRFTNIQDQYTGNDFESYCNHLSKYYPEIKGEINVVAEFLNGLTEIKEDESQTEYVKKVLNLVETSDLSENLKQVVRNAVIVGNASKKLWDEQ